MKDKSRLLELDVFRGLAALYVVGFHYASYFGDTILENAPPLSRYITGIHGVHLFFMISGFVIFMTLEKIKNPADFIVARFSRLFPGYWAAVLLAFISIRIFNYTEQGVSVKRTIANFSMIQHWVGVENVDGVYWTLSIELAFYFAMLLLFILKKFKYLEILGVGWLILMIIYEKVGFQAPDFLDIKNLLKCGHLFFAGILFYKLKFYGETWQRYACLGLCLLVQYVIKIRIHHNHYLDPVLGTLVTFVFFVAFYLFIKDKISFITVAPLVFLGDISYSLYLTHQSISCPIMKFLYARHADLFFVFFIPLVFSILLAAAVTYGIEKPAMAYIRSGYKKWQSARRK